MRTCNPPELILSRLDLNNLSTLQKDQNQFDQAEKRAFVILLSAPGFGHLNTLTVNNNYTLPLQGKAKALKKFILYFSGLHQLQNKS